MSSKSTPVQLFLAVALLAAFAACQEPPAAPPGATGRTLSEGPVCFDACVAGYHACTDQCWESFGFPGDHNEALLNNCLFNECPAQYEACRSQAIVFRSPGSICHFDLDTHFSHVTIEIYGVDVYGQDQACSGNDVWYKKRLLAEVDCSHWTALTDGSECGNRVQNKVLELIQQGYLPQVSAVDVDACPTPRYQ